MDDLQRAFTVALITAAKVIFSTKDSFVREKIFSKIYGLLLAYTSFSKVDTSISKTAEIKSTVSKIDELNEFYDYLEHSKLIKDSTLALAKRNALVFKLKLLKIKHDPKPEISTANVRDIFKPTQTSKDKNQQSPKLNPNKSKILGFIKKSPRTRAKEVIDQFSLLSDRTVKRNLAELIQDGLIQKKLENRAVYYYASDEG